jgi:group I intron endonuclease
MARKEKKYHFIYKTTNLLSGKYYIGMHSTDNLNDGYMGSGKRLRRSLNKYGIENHKVEILEFVNSRKELIEKEKEIVNLNEIAKEECMNITVGGEGGFISEVGYKKGAKKMNEIINKRKKEDPIFYNKWKASMVEKLKERHKEGKIRHDGFLGKSHTEDTKKLMSERKKDIYKGELHPQYGMFWITKDGVNKKIKKEAFEFYINDGWIKGRKF